MSVGPVSTYTFDQVDANHTISAVFEANAPVDSDGDGFTDDVDACPNEPAPDSEDGCPVPCEPLAIVTNVNFDFDKSDIRPDAAAKLEGVQGVLAANPDLLVRVVGHADSTGTDWMSASA